MTPGLQEGIEGMVMDGNATSVQCVGCTNGNIAARDAAMQELTAMQGIAPKGKGGWSLG